MKTAIARRRKHAEGLQYIRTCAEDKRIQGATMAEATRSQVAFADPFAGQWHPVGVAYAFWCDTNCKQNPRLALVASQGLRTAVANGGFREVFLLVYQGLSNVPRGVTIVDARQYLALQDFETLLNAGARIQHLADLTRLRACAGRQQSEYTWLLDEYTWSMDRVLGELEQGIPEAQPFEAGPSGAAFRRRRQEMDGAELPVAVRAVPPATTGEALRRRTQEMDRLELPKRRRTLRWTGAVLSRTLRRRTLRPSHGPVHDMDRTLRRRGGRKRRGGVFPGAVLRVESPIGQRHGDALQKRP